MLSSKSWGVLTAWFILLSILMTSIVLQRNGGLWHFEHHGTVPHYLSQQPLLSKIFDIRQTEQPTSVSNFQARELSYVTDWLDVFIILQSIKLGYAHSLSFTKIIGILILLVCFWIFFRSRLGLGIVSTTLLLVLFLLIPSTFWSAYFHRTAKIDAAVMIGISLCCMHTFFESKLSWISLVSLTLVFFLTTVTDPSGAAFIVSSLALLVFLLPQTRSLVICLTISSSLYLSYRFYIGPWMIQHLHGFSPSFMPMDLRHLQNPMGLVETTFWTLGKWLGFFMGNSGWVASVGLIALWAFALRKSTQKFRFMLLWGGGFCAAFAFLALCISQIPLMLSPAGIQSYYPLPFSVVFLFGLGNLVKVVDTNKKLNLIIGHASLFIIVVCGAFSLPQHKREIEPQGTDIRVVRWLEALRHVNDPGYVPPYPLEGSKDFLAYLSLSRS